ncbi:hypothetical protein RintRC_3147 [Richelia intracellularis]|nr:hypothetical protein RintRC_3147 [Richelia intracellularis]
MSCKNRWVMMADLIPWQEFEDEYASLFTEEMGAPAKSFWCDSFSKTGSGT